MRIDSLRPTLPNKLNAFRNKKNWNCTGDWEKIIPDSEYPIFVMAVLNNIKRPIIVETIITSIIGNKDVETKNILKVEKKNNNFFDDAHPFS